MDAYNQLMSGFLAETDHFIAEVIMEEEEDLIEESDAEEPEET